MPRVYSMTLNQLLAKARTLLKDETVSKDLVMSTAWLIVIRAKTIHLQSSLATVALAPITLQEITCTNMITNAQHSRKGDTSDAKSEKHLFKVWLRKPNKLGKSRLYLPVLRVTPCGNCVYKTPTEWNYIQLGWRIIPRFKLMIMNIISTVHQHNPVCVSWSIKVDVPLLSPCPWVNSWLSGTGSILNNVCRNHFTWSGQCPVSYSTE